MTAEVVVMNKLAVALAADSAVTINYPGQPKIYNSANKLFMLSPEHPIGIMFYGAAEFMEVPLEIIIKNYSDRLNRKRFDTLKEYADDFLNFLREENTSLFPGEQQDQYFQYVITLYFRVIYEDARNEFQEKVIREQGEITPEEFLETIVSTINDHYQEWNQYEDLSDLPEGYVDAIKLKAEIFFQEALNTVFSNIPLPEDSLSKMKQISIYLATKDRLPGGDCGVVVAGFGEKDIFPSIYSYELEALINGYLKYQEGQSYRINFSDKGHIISFAQDEMVATFLRGIHPHYRLTIAMYLGHLLSSYPSAVLESIPNLTEKEKEELLNSLIEAGQKMFLKFADDMDLYEQERHFEPIYANVANLPVDELAEMAESLVNLTSFKRKVSTEAETVGGPIDVAVISKRDGFIWIKRKKYFNSEDNPHFFNKYK